MDRGHEIKVLDHGYVKLIDYMGNDEAIIEAARMSTGRGFVSWEAYKRCRRCDQVEPGAGAFCATDVSVVDGRLQHMWQDFPRGDLGMLEFMWKNKHATPFEFGELHIEVQAPIMVFREWQRHRTQAYSEFSARYSQMPDLHYVPELSRIQKQSATNKQGSGQTVDVENASVFVHRIKKQQREVYDFYDEAVGLGYAKEVARLNTPVSRYSKMRAKTDLRNWLAFLLLRMAPAAQFEIRQYANAVAEMVKAIWPRTFALFEEHDLHGEHISRSEAAALRELISSHAVPTDAERYSNLWKRWGRS
jgi:thymidylate synthase (FAD)